jgi:hypothetical protein
MGASRQRHQGSDAGHCVARETVWFDPTIPCHNGYMPETPTASDLEKAHLILSEFGLLIGPAGEMSDVIGRAVAAGIATPHPSSTREETPITFASDNTH